MTEFAPAVLARWSDPFEAGTTVFADESFRLAIGAELDADDQVQILTRADRTIALVAPEVADLPGVGACRDEAGFRSALSTAGLRMNGADRLCFLPEDGKASLRAASNAAGVRRLTAADADAFASFESSASDQDLDDAYVELDHWAVFGAFVGDTLVAAGSAYPFEEDESGGLADFGVLTLSGHRGRGHARAVVHALARHVLELGFEPQYRCQLDNAGSTALAAKAGFVEYATWDALLP